MDFAGFNGNSQPKEHLSRRSFVIAIWLLVFIDVMFTIARLWIRLHKLKKLFWDDAIHCLALILLITSGALYTAIAPEILKISRVTRGVEPITVDFLTVDVPVYLRYQYAIVILFWSCLWCVKLAFMLFYRRFVRDLERHMIAWWIILAFVILSWLGCWVSFMVVAGGPGDFFNISKAITPRTQMRTLVDILYSTAADIVSDLLIMALPIRLLWHLRISRRKKLGLAAIFSLCVIDMVVAIVRAIETCQGLLPLSKTAGAYQQTDPIWLGFWSVLESSVAVLVSCLPTFRVLFKRTESPPTPSPGHGKVEWVKSLGEDSHVSSATHSASTTPAPGSHSAPHTPRKLVKRQRSDAAHSWAGSSRRSYNYFRWSSVKGARVSVLPVSSSSGGGDSSRSSTTPYQWTGPGRFSSRGSLYGPLDGISIPSSTMLAEGITGAGLGIQEPHKVVRGGKAYYERYSRPEMDDWRTWRRRLSEDEKAGGLAPMPPQEKKKTLRVVQPEQIGLAKSDEDEITPVEQAMSLTDAGSLTDVEGGPQYYDAVEVRRVRPEEVGVAIGGRESGLGDETSQSEWEGEHALREVESYESILRGLQS